MSRPLTARRWRLICIASLALNCALIGVIAGAAITGRGGDREARWRGSPLISALPDPVRSELREGRRSDPQDRRARFGALMDTLRADPFDPAALEALLREQRALGAARAERAEAGLIGALSRMSPAERAAYADRLEDKMRHRGARRE